MKTSFFKANGVTMLELVVVMVIIAIIASLGAPSFRKNMMRARSRDAIASVRIIRDANQIRLARGNASFSCAAAACTLAEINGINGTRSIYIVAQGATFSISSGTSLVASNADFKVCINKESPTEEPVCQELTSGACSSNIGTCP